MSKLEVRPRPTIPFSVQLVMAALMCACVALGIVTFLISADWQRAVAQARSAENNVQRLEGAIRRLDEDTERLKAVFGYGFPEIGPGEPQDPTTLLGAYYDDIGQIDDQAAPRTIREVIAALKSSGDQYRVERDALLADKSRLEQRLLGAADTWSAKLDIQAGARQQAQQELRDTISQEFERTETQRRALAAADQERQQLQIEVDELRDLLADKGKQWQQRETGLLTTIDHLRSQLDERQPGPLATVDGEIRQIDVRGRSVYVNRGSDDLLRSGVQFRVYAQGATNQTPKATIRVAEVIGPHLARAVVLEDDPRDPILRGDPIESPVWTPGKPEKIAFAGVIDVDADGRSDWDRVKLMVELAGAEIVAYVDAQGNRQGEPLGPDVRYLVVGDSPDPTSARRPEDKEQRTNLLTTGTSLRREARENGIEILSLPRFLEQLGGKPGNRLGAMGATR